MIGQLLQQTGIDRQTIQTVRTTMEVSGDSTIGDGVLNDTDILWTPGGTAKKLVLPEGTGNRTGVRVTVCNVDQSNTGGLYQGSVLLSSISAGSCVELLWASGRWCVLTQFMVERLTTLNISTGSKSTDLNQYLSAGSSPKPDGWRVKVTWAGGGGTYAHSFISSLNLANEYIDLPPGDNSSTFAWCGYGSGGLTLVKDEANSRWIVETEGCFDKVFETSVNGQRIIQRVDKTMRVEGSISGGDGVAEFDFSENYDVSFSPDYNPTRGAACRKSGNSTNAVAIGVRYVVNDYTVFQAYLDEVNGYSSGTFVGRWWAEGEWRD